MNRVIKFRAWHTVVCEMLNWDKLKNLRTAIQNKDVILMQFTGLLDKNGVEIYEGDILSVPNRNYEKNGKIINGDSIVYFESGMFKCNNLSLCTHKGFEIVGNIYEHKHLLI